MATKKKMLQAAAGQAGGAALNVEDVFSTYLYEGNGSTQTITNGIDLDGEGGLVWTKSRSMASLGFHQLIDTERGAGKFLLSESTQQESTDLATISAFGSDGYNIGSDAQVNTSAEDYASWTFRKAPKFFDVVTYTGDGTNGRQISHNLGHDVGMMLIKKTSSSDDWRVFHRSQSNKYAVLNSTFQFQTDGGNIFGNPSNGTATAPTSTHFTVANDASVNQSGETYVAYLFAHNDGDGEFGGEADADIIKCGSFTPPSSGEQEVTLGFEPQFIITFDTGGGDNWRVYDIMRGWDVSNRQLLNPNGSSAESSLSNTSGYEIKPTSTGFIHEGHTASSPHIYIAIRRGTKVPESATEVFDVDAYSGNSTAGRIIPSAFPVDLAIVQSRSAAGDTNAVADRLRGANVLLNTPNTHAELTNNTDSITGFDFMDGIEIGTDTRTNWSSGTYVSWMWKRAPGYFDVVAYTGNQTAGHNISHNLGVAPEMIWVKKRDGAADWRVYHSGIGATKYLTLNTTAASATHTTLWNDTAPTDSVFTLGTESSVNSSGGDYIAYLFASLDGISKVGSFTGNGGSQTIDCGFTSGARFVLIKRVSATSNWLVFDTERGIVSGNDPYLFLDTIDAEDVYGSFDEIDPHPSGFTFNYNPGGFALNGSGSELIFYAIA